MSQTLDTRQDAVKSGEALDALLHRVVALNKLFGAVGETLALPGGQTLARTVVLRQARPEPIPVAEIARRLGLKRQSVQRVADLLVDDGLLAFRENPSHRRAKLAQLTPAGRETLRAIDAAQRDWAKRVGSEVGRERLEEANRLLDEVHRAVQTQPEGNA